MREIKFRGKDNFMGEWVYGDLSTINLLNKTLIYIGPTAEVEVDPETVGQYTGLKDKNGTEIYEGDIIFRQDEVGHVEFSEDGSFLIRFPHHLARINATWGPIEVIGNIYDNPELLGGEE